MEDYDFHYVGQRPPLSGLIGNDQCIRYMYTANQDVPLEIYGAGLEFVCKEIIRKGFTGYIAVAFQSSFGFIYQDQHIADLITEKDAKLIVLTLVYTGSADAEYLNIDTPLFASYWESISSKRTIERTWQFKKELLSKF
jgi:hypothetical protein